MNATWREVSSFLVLKLEANAHVKIILLVVNVPNVNLDIMDTLIVKNVIALDSLSAMNKMVNQCSNIYIHYLEEKCLHAKASVWNKISLNTGCVGGTLVDPPSCKTFFFGPWLLVNLFIEISNQMELNGEVSNFEK